MAARPPRSAPRVVHRRYVPYSHAHYAGNLVDGAYSLGLFGDVATEMCIRTDGDEGLFASYSDVQFRAPVRAGDVLEVTCELTRVGTRSRVIDFARARGGPRRGDAGPAGRRRGARPSRSLATTATGTVVVPPLTPDATPSRRVAARHAAARATDSCMNSVTAADRALTCAFARSPQVSGRLTATRCRSPRVLRRPLMQIVAGGPTSEWPASTGASAIAHPGRRSAEVGPLRESGRGRGPAPPRQQPGPRQPVADRVGPKGAGPFRSCLRALGRLRRG